jgi:hypothetical protein
MDSVMDDDSSVFTAAENYALDYRRRSIKFFVRNSLFDYFGLSCTVIRISGVLHAQNAFSEETEGAPTVLSAVIRGSN